MELGKKPYSGDILNEARQTGFSAAGISPVNHVSGGGFVQDGENIAKLPERFVLAGLCAQLLDGAAHLRKNSPVPKAIVGRGPHPLGTRLMTWQFEKPFYLCLINNQII